MVDQAAPSRTVLPRRQQAEEGTRIKADREVGLGTDLGQSMAGGGGGELANGLHDSAAAALEEGRGGDEAEAARCESSGRDGAGSSNRPMFSVQFAQKMVAEVVGTYILIFAGCAAVAVNLRTGGAVTFPGICLVWGLAVTVMVYSIGHISGAHLNPAVSIAFATCGRFPWRQVPPYAAAQLAGATAASLALRLLFGDAREHFFGTVPAGSDVQSLVVEFFISFNLMFAISGVATDNRAIGELAGLAVGATVLLNVLFAGPISGGSMNPARTLGPAIVVGRYAGIWVYFAGPICGTVAGAWVYNLIRFTDRPLREITQTSSFLKSARRN